MAQRIDRAASFGQNLYVDTRGAAGEPVPFTQAVINGLAQGGGLYVPEELPTLSLDEICALARLPYAQRAAAIYKAFNVDLPDEAIDELMGRAYGDNFDDEAICPITSLDESTHILELWHGPTSAFKDMALQCLPHFFSASAEKLREEGTLDHEFMILVATSGDTGKAALEGFKGVDGVSIGVLFPDGGVSDIQRKQMVTTTGDNVQVWAVRGNFDDCQTGVKHAFADEKFAEKLLDEYRIALSSANSINWGRLLPQVVYYISSYAELVAAGKIEAGCPIDVCVPTGNFGNILAAWYAKQIGVPIERLLCASNDNRVLTDFINTGTYDISDREFILTSSPSMDILLQPRAPALRAHGPQWRGYSPVDGRSGRRPLLPRRRRDVPPRAGELQRRFRGQRHLSRHHPRSARRPRLPAGSPHRCGLRRRSEPARREPRPHRLHGPLGKIRQQRLPGDSRHRAFWRVARGRGRAHRLRAEQAHRRGNGQASHPRRTCQPGYNASTIHRSYRQRRRGHRGRRRGVPHPLGLPGTEAMPSWAS